MANFITEEDFKKSVSEKTAVKWGEIPQNAIYYVNKIKPEKTKYGIQYILTLTTADGITYRAWAPDRLKTDIDELDENKKEKIYVQPLGLVNSIQNPERKYHNYNIITHE